MAAVGELVLVLGLLVSAHCEVRARDPGVEEEEEAQGGGGGGGGAVHLPHLTRLHPGTTQTPPLGETATYPARTGNWCAFVQKHTVTAAVACGTEKYIIKSQSLCPSGLPDCQLVMYKLSTRLAYTQTKKVVTKLHWACCQGHRGHNCEDTVPDPQLDSGSSGVRGRHRPESEELRAPEVHTQPQRADPNREQNDHDAGYTAQQHNTTHTTSQPDHAPNLNHTRPHNANGHRHHHQEQHNPVEVDIDVIPYSDTPAALPVPHMMALVMSQLQPFLQAFNRSLEHLNQQVGDLAREVAQLKSSQQGPEMQAGPPELDNAAEERLDARLDEVFHEIRVVGRQVENQRTDLENRLHSQHAMLHYNLTSFKTDVDMKLKRHQKMVQASLQAMNASLSELKLDQDQSPVDHLEGHLPPPAASQPPQSSDTSGLWEAIKLLDNMVVNNTVKVTGLMEDVEVTSGKFQRLKLDVVKLNAEIVKMADESQVNFMEMVLDLDDAKALMLRRVSEVEGNMSLQIQRLGETDEDVDHLFKALNNSSSRGCNCQELNDAVVRLEKAVANVTELAQENRLALEESSEGGDKQWDSTSDWARTVEALQHGLQQVKESLASEQSGTRTLDQNLNQLRDSVTSSLAEVTSLKETDRSLVQKTEDLSSSFQSLLQDGIRHSRVLELVLGEEVLEFLDWPEQDQEAHSIPALKQQLREQGASIESLLKTRPGGREEVPSADQPSSSPYLLHSDMRRSRGAAPARERQLLLHPEHKGDGSDLWNLEKQVEELKLKLLRLEGKPCPCSNTSAERELQAEVMWLKTGLEEHLGVFKNIFSNTDVLAGSDATLDLDKLWELLKSKDGKKDKKRGGGGGGGQEGRRGNHRSRRASSGVPSLLSGQLDNSLLFVAGSPLSVSKSTVTFKASVKTDQFQPDTGTFTAPVDGVYLFIATLDLRPGPAHVVLRKGGALVSLHRQKVAEAGPVTGVGLLLLRQGEEVRLELRGGVRVESGDNVFTGLLLHRTT